MMGPKSGLATYKLHMVCVCTLTPRIPTNKEKPALTEQPRQASRMWSINAWIEPVV